MDARTREAKLRTDAALRLIVYGLAGRLELTTAIDGALRLLDEARQWTEAA